MCDKAMYDWKAGTRPLSSADSFLTGIMLEELPNIKVATIGKSKVFPVWKGKEITRRIKVNNAGKLVKGQKKLSRGEFIYITDKMEAPKYIVRDIPSALVIFNETRHAVAVYMDEDNLPDVIDRFPEAKVITGAGEKRIVSAFSDRVIEIMKFGNNRDEQNLFKGKKFNTVREYFLDGGDINIMLETGKHTRMAPLWWKQKRGLQPSWLIAGMVPEGPSLITVFAPSGIGKTYFVLALGLAVAVGGGDFFGHKARGAKVLYLCGEGEAAVSTRVQCWLEQHNIADARNVKFYIDTVPFSFDNDADYSDFIKALEERFVAKKPDIVILDTQNLFMENDENSTQGASLFIKRLKTFTAEYSCAVILVHHTGKHDENTGRGSSAVKGGVDVEMKMTLLPGGILKVEQTKNRNGRPMEPIYMKLEEHDIEAYRDAETGKTIRDCILVQAEAPKADKTKGEEFLFEFCVDRALNGKDWMEFTYDDLYEFGKEYWEDSTKVSANLSPTQDSKALGSLLKSHIIVEIEAKKEKQVEKTGRKSKYSGTCYRLNKKSTIAEIKESIASAEDF